MENTNKEKVTMKQKAKAFYRKNKIVILTVGGVVAAVGVRAFIKSKNEISVEEKVEEGSAKEPITVENYYGKSGWFLDKTDKVETDTVLVELASGEYQREDFEIEA